MSNELMKEKLWEIEQLQARIAELEAEVANLNDWLTTWKESFSLAQAEIAQLQADNRSLVKQMNATALKPNQEVVTWHECSEGVPTDSGHYLILCEDGDVYIDWFNNGSDEAGNLEDHCPWGDPEWLIEVHDPGAYKVIAWAYLPKGAKHE